MKNDIDYNMEQIESLLEATVIAAHEMAKVYAQPFWDKENELTSKKSLKTTD